MNGYGKMVVEIAGAYAKDLEGLTNLPGLGIKRRENIYFGKGNRGISQGLSLKPGRFLKPSRFRDSSEGKILHDNGNQR